MPRLPALTGREVVKALRKIGYELDRQHGSHMILRQPDPLFRRLVVPDHKERGMLRAIIRQAGLSVLEFLELI